MTRLETQRYSHWPLAVWLLARALARPDADARRKAARLLGRIKSRQAVAALAVRLTDDVAGVRQAAAWALGEIEDARALPGLAEAALRDRDAAVREAAIAALGAIGYPASAGFLLDLIPNPDHGAAAVRALARLLIGGSRRHISTGDLMAIAALENHALPTSLQNAGHPASAVGYSWRQAQRLAVQELARRQQDRDASTDAYAAWDDAPCIA